MLISQDRAFKGKKYKEYKSLYNAQLKCLGVGSPGSYSVEVGVSQRKKKDLISKKQKKQLSFQFFLTELLDILIMAVTPKKPF